MGNLLSFIFPPKSRFSFDDIPDQSGRIAIITGGNSGIGMVACKVLLSKGAKVYMASRSKERALPAINQLKQATGKTDIHLLELDLADLQSVRRAAEEFTRKENRLHMLFNNGGVMTPPIEQLTKQGYDLQFGATVLGHAYLTKLLLPVLLSTAEEAPGKVRVVHTSSCGHANAVEGGIDIKTLTDGPARTKAGTWQMYFQSKWGNAAYSSELAGRYGSQGLVSIAFDPGNIRTSLHKNMPKLGYYILNTILLYDLEPYGGLQILYAGTMPQAGKLNGCYLVPWARIGNVKPDTRDPSLGARLWQWCEEEIAKFEQARRL
ncbi:NADP-binding protein [Dacryopinax primogenitus]|uniref:NADP-binding protein n=1 Tax=Dacryopinax primogenitus (strain DJM 731) TaxID=1858805 RepID=M5G351_DACPD|nr:NADP-binding protein [Dacryopinax primogenitus]EJT98177.1 NADP-binding protein [Dacryopinax primogenitus]